MITNLRMELFETLLDTFIMSASGAGGERRGGRAAGHQGVLVWAAGRARRGQLAAGQAVPR